MIVDSPPSTDSPDDSQFDFVIVGSGAGGAPLAARLAEYGHTVLVLEAGPDHSTLPATAGAREVSEVPALHAPSTEHPDLSWRFFVDHYKEAPEPDPKWTDDGKIFYPRATGIGGCTIHNAMITIAGPAGDWDELAWFLNDPSWHADVMRGYFQRMEHCEYHPGRPRPRTAWAQFWDTFWWLFGRDDDPTVGRHGFDGWLHTSVVDLELGLRDKQLLKMLKAAAVASTVAGMEAPWRLVGQLFRGEAGEALDPNHSRRQTERPEGVVLIPTAVYGQESGDEQSRGHRSSPARRLLDAANRLHDRLVIATDCLATKVILQSDPRGSWHATGVEYLHGSRLYRANPNPSGGRGTPGKIHVKPGGEVILCGGAFNTPQLLMLSGIGCRTHLAQHGIECRVHSPGVGQNLQDRYEVTVISRMNEKFSLLEGATFKLLADPEQPDGPLRQWRQSGQGLYATNGAVLGIMKRSTPELPQPDLFIFGIPLKFKGYALGYSVVSPDEFDLFTWAILKSHTKNRGGTVRLASNNPTATPDINFNYFHSAEESPPNPEPDLEALVHGVRFVRDIARRAGGVVDEEYHPGPGVKNDDDVRRWIRREAWGHHACGTCRMGRWTDPLAVTDSRFRVLGCADERDPERSRGLVAGLRIVDASIFPNIPGYFIVTNIYMASEKAADVIHEARTGRPAAAHARAGTTGGTSAP